MNSSPAVTALESRLLQRLQELELLAAKPGGGNLAEKLAGLFDLADSITLAESLRALGRVRHKPKPQAAALAQLLNTREEMLNLISDSFRSDATSAPFPLPQSSVAALADETEAFQPYQRFYTLHQSEMDHRIQRLRKGLRQTLAAHSAEMAQLAALDRIVAEPLVDHSRRALAAVPRLLHRHFIQLRNGSPKALKLPEHWLGQFLNDMQELLIAELDFRLLPALGLTEALEIDALEREEPHSR